MSSRSEILASSAERILIDAKLERIDLPTLFTICVELLTVCAKRSVEIDPAAAAMVAYARDEILKYPGDGPLSATNWRLSTAHTAPGCVKRTRD